MFDDLKEKSYTVPNGMDVVADLRKAIERGERLERKLTQERAARQQWIDLVDEWQVLAERAEDVAWQAEEERRRVKHDAIRQGEWEARLAATRDAVQAAIQSVQDEQRAGVDFTNPLLAVASRIALAWRSIDAGDTQR